jgi:hypothetical protein
MSRRRARAIDKIFSGLGGWGEAGGGGEKGKVPRLNYVALPQSREFAKTNPNGGNGCKRLTWVSCAGCHRGEHRKARDKRRPGKVMVKNGHGK